MQAHPEWFRQIVALQSVEDRMPAIKRKILIPDSMGRLLFEKFRNAVSKRRAKARAASVKSAGTQVVGEAFAVLSGEKALQAQALLEGVLAKEKKRSLLERLHDIAFRVEKKRHAWFLLNVFLTNFCTEPAIDCRGIETPHDHEVFANKSIESIKKLLAEFLCKKAGAEEKTSVFAMDFGNLAGTEFTPEEIKRLDAVLRVLRSASDFTTSILEKQFPSTAMDGISVSQVFNDRIGNALYHLSATVGLVNSRGNRLAETSVTQ